MAKTQNSPSATRHPEETAQAHKRRSKYVGQNEQRVEAVWMQMVTGEMSAVAERMLSCCTQQHTWYIHCPSNELARIYSVVGFFLGGWLRPLPLHMFSLPLLLMSFSLSSAGCRLIQCLIV